MQRIKTSAALVFASVLLLSGCAAGGDGDGDGGEATTDPCETVSIEVRDISNGAQNALAAGGDPSEVQAALEGYVERVATLDETAGDDAEVSEALDALSEKLYEAAVFAETLPSDPEAEVDAEAVGEHQTAIQEAATEVTSACAPATEG
jgi:predicted ArsR family transcriptional regulator